MELEVIIGIAVAAVGFIAVVARGYVKYIAPQTKTEKDDQIVGKIADIAEDVADFAGGDEEK